MKLGHLEGVWKTTRSLGDLQLTMVIKDWVDLPSTWLEVPTIDTCTSGTSKSQQYVSMILYYTSNNPRTPEKSGSVVTSMIGLFSN